MTPPILRPAGPASFWRARWAFLFSGSDGGGLDQNTLVLANVLIVLDPLEVAAEPNRRRLLQLLAGGERTVTELAGEFTVSRSAISQHLLLLEQAGLVSARKEGRNRYYRPDPRGMAELRRLFDQFWTNELDLLVADAQELNRAKLPTSKEKS